jgi:glycosyltransferase 2 family protein
VVSLISLGAVAWWISKQPAPTLPSSASGLGWLTFAVSIALSSMVLRGFRWHRIMALARIDHRRSDALGLMFVGQMGNTVLPARGGDVMRIALLGARSASRKREILGSVVAERALDAVVLVATFAILSLGLADSPAGPGTAAAIAAALALGFGALAGYLWLRRSGRFERFAAAIRPVARASKLFAHPSGIALVALTAAIWMLDGLCLLVLARSVGEHLGAPDALLALVLAALATAIPAAPGFAGTFDAAMVVALRRAGVLGGAAVGVLILARFVFFVPATLVGLVVLVTRYGGFSRALRVERAAAG